METDRQTVKVSQSAVSLSEEASDHNIIHNIFCFQVMNEVKVSPSQDDHEILAMMDDGNERRSILDGHRLWQHDAID
jgi:hypothetical protein